jgi:hypothetical protein
MTYVEMGFRCHVSVALDLRDILSQADAIVLVVSEVVDQSFKFLVGSELSGRQLPEAVHGFRRKPKGGRHGIEEHAVGLISQLIEMQLDEVGSYLNRVA